MSNNEGDEGEAVQEWEDRVVERILVKLAARLPGEGGKTGQPSTSSPGEGGESGGGQWR